MTQLLIDRDSGLVNGVCMDMASLKLGHVHLKVRNLDRSIAFYQQVFELTITERVGGYVFMTDGGAHHTVALQELGMGAIAPPDNAVGLYHVAFEVDTPDQFNDFRDRLAGLTEAVAVDHGISWALYFDDPDGIGLEVYLDRRTSPGGRTLWREQQDSLGS